MVLRTGAELPSDNLHSRRVHLLLKQRLQRLSPTALIFMTEHSEGPDVLQAPRGWVLIRREGVPSKTDFSERKAEVLGATKTFPLLTVFPSLPAAGSRWSYDWVEA